MSDQTITLRPDADVSDSTLRDALLRYLAGGAKRVFPSRDDPAVRVVELHGVRAYAFAQHPYAGLFRAFEVALDDRARTIVVTTRGQDELTYAVAAGFADACARWWGTGSVQTNTGMRQAG